MVHLKKLLIFACAALLLAGALGANALAFSFQEGAFTLEIPERENVYYYTQKGSNMTGEMLENAKKQDVLCLIGEYGGDGRLLYTFKAEQYNGSAAEAAEQLRRDLAQSYELGEGEAAELNGKSGVVLKGTSRQNPSYLVTLSIYGDSPSVVFTAMHTASAEQTAMALLSSVEWPGMDRDPDAVPLPQTGQEPEPSTPESAPEPTEEATDGPAALAPVEEESPGLLANAASLGEKHGRLLVMAALVLFTLALVLLLVLLLRHPRYTPRHRQRSRARHRR